MSAGRIELQLGHRSSKLYYHVNHQLPQKLEIIGESRMIFISQKHIEL